VNLFRYVKPVYERYFDSVASLQIKYDGEGTEIHIAPEKTIKVQSLLSSNNYNPNDPLIVLCPSATYLNKRWKMEGFIETGKYFIKNHGAFVIVLGGNEDMLLCNDLAKAIGGRGDGDNRGRCNSPIVRRGDPGYRMERSRGRPRSLS
jgi:ADP-heptose:LPS heptosyltransferase